MDPVTLVQYIATIPGTIAGIPSTLIAGLGSTGLPVWWLPI